MTELPEPLVPAEVDLRAFQFMPLDVGKLRDSDLATEASAEGFRAAVLLWCAAWHQQPAASLPNKPAVLAKLAGFGRDVAAWKAVSKEALRNFVECSDGRLYHPLIAAKALDGWKRKHEWDENREKERVRKAEWRARKAAEKAAAAGTGRGRPAGQDADETRDATGLSRLRQGQGTLDRDIVTDRPSDARARAVPVVQNGQSPLATKVLSAFVEKSADKGLTWPPTEIEHVNRLVERAEMEPDPEAWCKRFLETAWRLKQSGAGIWKDRPWMPRTFCGVKAITWVIEAMAASAVDPEMGELMQRQHERYMAKHKRGVK